MLLDKIYRSFWNSVDVKDKARVDKETFPEKVTATLDIPYISDGNKWHLLDVFRPEGEEKLPLIIDIHGGGLMGGTKLGNRTYCYHLASHGFLVMAPDYSLSPEVRYPGHLADVNEALFWIKAHAEEYGWDGKNVVLTGDSAGGFLAMHETLVVNDQRVADVYGLKRPDFRFNCIVLTSGMYDLDKGAPVIMFPGIFGTWRKKKAPFFDKLDLAQWVTKENVPPCMLITSDDDFIRFSTVHFHEVLQEKGIMHQLNDYKKMDEQKLEHVFAVLLPSTPAGTKCVKDTVEFIRKYIK